MQIRPKILLRYGRVNEPIRVPIIDLLVDPPAKTFLTVNTAAASFTLIVKNTTSFSGALALLIGQPGQQGSEIISLSSVDDINTISLGAATSFPHSYGTPIFALNFDQVEISHAPTVSGSKTVLATLSLVANETTTDYNDLTYTTGYYFARFVNSVDVVYSPYSDASPIGSYTEFSARAIIDSALGEINKETSEVLSDEFAFQQILSCQMEVVREYKRWSFLQVFNAVLGQSVVGGWKIAVPTNLDDQNTNKSTWHVRLGTGPDLTWIDKDKWDEIIDGVANTTLASNIIVTAATITLTDSGDFPDQGVVNIGANSYTYTANNRTTNVLTLSTPSTTTNTAGDDAFFGASFGQPQYWTIFGGYYYVYPVVGTDFDDRNFYSDYYKKVVPITTDSDEIVLADPTVVQYYLQWKFLKKLNNGEETDASKSAMALYITRREKLKQKEVIGRTFKLKPRFNNWARQETFGEADGKRDRLRGWIPE